MEQTLSIIKPDAVERDLENEIKYFFKNRGKTKTRDKILKEMKARNLIEIEGDLDSYGCKIKVV